MPVLVVLLLALGTLWGLVAPRAPAPLDGPVDRIVIDKSDRTLILLRDGEAVRAYAVGLGFAPEGTKERQGDGRTPEGVFHIDRRNDASRFHLSLGLDYPRPADVARAEAGGYSPGGDIFIHGQPPAVPAGFVLPGDWTAGCVAVSDRAMDEIWDVAPIGTIVEIVP